MARSSTVAQPFSRPHAAIAMPRKIERPYSPGDDERALQQLIDALARQDGKDDVRRLFHSIDSNGDGRISREEWARGVLRDGPAMAKYFGGTTYEGLVRAFDRIDANGDNTVTRAEIDQARAMLASLR